MCVCFKWGRRRKRTFFSGSSARCCHDLPVFTWIIIPYWCFQQTFGIFWAPRTNNFQSRAVPVPSGEALRVLSSDSSWCPVGAPEDNGNSNWSCRHVTGLGSWVYNLIDCLHGEVERHEFTHWSQPCLLNMLKYVLVCFYINPIYF